ncbi:MAG: nucleotidyltransferase domain-containing protein [Candidatus Competibacteraceae bacterium]|nr:nucleotidyltransferase domain-containing protein [Candidatus Competibacteraceae bacterium]
MIAVSNTLPVGVRRALDRLADDPAVERIVLYGSRARGDHESRSDVDLAIAAPKADDRHWLQLVFDLEEADTLLAINPVRLEEVSADFRERILREGRVLYERD